MKILIHLIIISFIIFISYRIGLSNSSNTIIEKTDTIYKTDTIEIIKPIEKYKYITKYITDTLYTTDSTKTEVNIPITTTIYKDSTYEASVSGFKASLDYLILFPKQTTIYQEKVSKIKEKQPLIKHGVQVGVGYLPLSNKIEPYIGYGLQITF
jgi:hypothetical protein